ncbi:hypothetical protein SAMN05216464_11340 [Mucilaginibacter pineti]|uniref:Uncharacterized protein n=1 Tax=Mucilaginibacter pineti TaxID=1391627 RepID=A0A1G7IJB9_9SPHI|nr:hypothetical protein [Mucilaginibacter pineti]SDF12389.1 hypothetical protein SAMN05216464_11340 [Mucilaginibacter pineti]
MYTQKTTRGYPSAYGHYVQRLQPGSGKILMVPGSFCGCEVEPGSGLLAGAELPVGPAGGKFSTVTLVFREGQFSPEEVLQGLRAFARVELFRHGVSGGVEKAGPDVETPGILKD